jgi:hypothetical protein
MRNWLSARDPNGALTSPGIQSFQVPKIEKTWPSASLKELNPPTQNPLLRPRQDKRGFVLPCHLGCIQLRDLCSIRRDKKI